MYVNHTPACLRLLASVMLLLCVQSEATTAPATPQRDGSHDFDFLIGDWKAHVRRLPDRLVGSTRWVEYDGISRHKKILDSNANFEEFEVNGHDKDQHIKGQTLRLYNPDSHQWSIYLVDIDKGVLSMPPVVGEFTGRRGEFYDQDVIEDGRVRREAGYTTDLWTRRGIEFIEQNRERPFFLFLAYNGPYSLGNLMLNPARNRHAEYYADKPLFCFPRDAMHPWQFSNKQFHNSPAAWLLSAAGSGPGGCSARQ